MAKRIRPTKIGKFSYGQDFDWAAFTLTEGDEEYNVQMLTPHFQGFSSSISELAEFLTDKMDAIQGSGIVAPRQVTKIEALPGVDRHNVVLEITMPSGHKVQYDLSVSASRELRLMMEDAEKFTSGKLGQTTQ